MHVFVSVCLCDCVCVCVCVCVHILLARLALPADAGVVCVLGVCVWKRLCV